MDNINIAFEDDIPATHLAYAFWTELLLLAMGNGMNCSLPNHRAGSDYEGGTGIPAPLPRVLGFVNFTFNAPLRSGGMETGRRSVRMSRRRLP